MSVVTPTIKSNGQTMNPTYGLMQIDVLHEVNRVPSAQLVLSDGSIAQREFVISQSDFFAIGNEIEIYLRYEGQPHSDTKVFKGIVTGQTVEANDYQSRLTVDMKDPSVKMTTLRQTAIFRDQKDSEVFATLADNHGLGTDTIDDTTLQHKELVQYDATDWDFLLLRAEANGLLVNVKEGKLSVVAPKIKGKAQHSYEFGMSDIYSLELRADAERQFGSVQTNAWDMAEQALSPPENGEDFPLVQGADGINPTEVADTVGGAEYLATQDGARVADEMMVWAKSRLMRSRLALYRGWLSVKGQSDIAVLDTIEIAGISNKFNGRTLVTAIRQQMGATGWRTDIQCGLEETPFAQSHPNLQSLPAQGLLPAVRGLYIGIVDSFESDPDQHYRVRVRLPTWRTEGEVIWARYVMPDAGNGRGIFFYPEPGDEVVIGFLGDDPRDAIILGSLYSSALPAKIPHDELTEDNFKKGIFTKDGLEIQFDDEKKTITIQTVENQTIIMNGQDKKITISDANDNMITMSDKGIQFKSGSDILIEASGKVEIKGSTVDVK